MNKMIEREKFLYPIQFFMLVNHWDNHLLQSIEINWRRDKKFKQGFIRIPVSLLA